ncbi:MAG TPA: hypothetical protein VMM13_02670 [Euzebya sp.]|nr:hypothetical protein [Euzebya sp.]
MTSRPSPRSERRTAAVAMWWRGRAVPVVCTVLVGVLTVTACSGSDTSAAAPPGTEFNPPFVEPVEPTATPSATPDPATPEPESADPETPEPVVASVVDRADPATFDHDQVRPVNVEVIGTEGYLGVELTRIQFPSQDGGMATGVMALPADPATDVGILWAHGLPGNARDSFDPMAVFACAGATSIVVNAPYARPAASRPDGAVTNGDQPVTFSPTDRDEQIQLIRDMRRAIDVLQDRGAERIGFGGISYGAAIGAALIGVDDRVEAANLTLGNSGLVERFTDEDGTPSFHLDDLTAEEIETWMQALLPIEPARFIGDSGATILFMNGLDDSIIPRAEAERFHAAAPRGEVRWMDVGHDVPFADFLWHNRWLGTPLGMDTERLDACAEQVFPDRWAEVPGAVVTPAPLRDP